MRLDFGFLRSHVEARRSVETIAVEQRHGRHAQFRAARDQALRQGRSFEKAESRAGVEFNVHRAIWSSDHRVILNYCFSNHPMARSPDHPISFSHNFLPTPIARRPNHELSDRARSLSSPALRCPIRLAPRHPVPTSLRTSATGRRPTELRLQSALAFRSKCEMACRPDDLL